MAKLLLRLTESSSDLIEIIKNASGESKTSIINRMLLEWIENHKPEIEALISKRNAEINQSLKLLASKSTTNGLTQ